jgi:CBS domain-containing protein
MTARELMSTPPRTCQPNTDLAAVTQLMWNHDCGFVPVVDAAGHLAGVITDRDICVASATRRLLPERISAAQAMSASVYACLPNDDVESVLTAMKTHQIRRVPVVDADGHLQGVVSLNDVVRAVGKKDAPAAAEVVATLASICAPRAMESAVA